MRSAAAETSAGSVPSQLYQLWFVLCSSFLSFLTPYKRASALIGFYLSLAAGAGADAGVSLSFVPVSDPFADALSGMISEAEDS